MRGRADRAVLLGSGGSLPAIRQELVNAALGPARGQFPKYVGEVRKRRDTPQRACPRDAVENRSPLRRPMRAEEEEIVPAECDGPQLLFA